MGSDPRQLALLSVDPLLFDHEVTLALQGPNPLHIPPIPHAHGPGSEPPAPPPARGLPLGQDEHITLFLTKFRPGKCFDSQLCVLAPALMPTGSGSGSGASSRAQSAATRTQSTAGVSAYSPALFPQVQVALNSRPVFVGSRAVPDVALAWGRQFGAVTLEFAFVSNTSPSPVVVAQLPGSGSALPNF